MSRKNRTSNFTPSHDSDYSDDFDARNDSDYSGYSSKRSANTIRSDDTFLTTPTTVKSEKSPQNKKKNKFNQQSKRSRSLSNQAKPFPARNNVQQRVISARKNRINQLYNEMNEMRSKVDELNKENRLLKTLQYRQSKALKKLEDTENDLPKIISRHMEEQRILKMRLRKSKERERSLENQMKISDERRMKSESQLNKYKKLVEDRNLVERSELSRNLSEVQDKLFEVERRNQDLKRNLELNSQSYTRQIRRCESKHHQTKLELKQMKENYRNLQIRLKEKERQLDVSNIYSLRSSKNEKSETSMITPVTSNHTTPRKVEKQTSPASILAAMPPQQSLVQISPEKDESLSMSQLEVSPILPVTQSASSKDDEKLSKPSRPIFFTETSALSQSTNVDLNPKIVVEEQHKDLPDPNPKDFRVQTEVNIQKAQHPEAESLLFSDLSIKEDVTPKDAAPTDVTPTDAAPVESEDDKRKKQMLLARMREIDSKEARDEKSPEVMKISAKKEASDLKIENLHKGLPSELTFGEYSPSIHQSANRDRSKLKREKIADNHDNKDDVIFDLESGKQNKKSENLLTQLFGEQALQTTKSSSQFKEERTYDGYPWERNVQLSRATDNNNGNGDVTSLIRKKSSSRSIRMPIDDDIEELIL